MGDLGLSILSSLALCVVAPLATICGRFGELIGDKNILRIGFAALKCPKSLALVRFRFSGIEDAFSLTHKCGTRI
jgi:hypothetical protein